MDVQDNGGTDSNTIGIGGNRNCLDVETQSVTGVQPKEIYSSGDEHAPKVRKPYTITKQREKWTEEEHKKFLEALKLYGRAWRRIEEHVGTKTAVQIRSHAQKFFSKVVRESSASNADSVKPIEIPPPRPKRKPMHPYPRKLVHLIKRGISVAEQPERSPSPNLSVSDQANQSPKSVLSAVGSDTMGYADSNLENGSLSPVSSTSSANPLSLLLTEQENGDLPSTSLAEEEDGSPMVLVISDSISQKQFGMKVSLGSEDNTGNKEDSTSKAPPMSFKLFGRTVLVTDSHKPSSTTEGTHKSFPAQGCQENADRNDENPLQTSQWNLMQTDFAVGTNKGTGSSWPCEAPPVLYYMQSQKEEPYQVEAASAAALPWWAMYGGLPFPFLRSPLPSSAQRPIDSCMEDATEDKAFHKEGSWTGSNSASVNDVGVGDKNGYVVDSGNHQEPTSGKEEKEPSPAFWLRQSETSAFSKPKPNPYNKCMKGFMPYKRCIAERDAQSSGIMGEEREGQKIRLCL